MSRAPGHLVRRHRSSEYQMRPTQSLNEHGSQPRAGRRHRRIGMVMLIAGVIVLVAAFAPTSANAVIDNSALVPAGPASFNINCTGADETTNLILTGVGLNPLTLPATMTTNAIDSPADGEQFTLDLTTQFVLPASIVA